MGAWLRGAAVALALVGLAPAAWASGFLARPLELVVPYAAGGGTDVVARLVAERLAAQLGGRVEVRNVVGGGGSIGTSQVLHAPPDGYTIGTGSQGPLAMLPQYGGLDYGIDDVDFIALIARNRMVLVARAGLPFADAETLLAHARAHPGTVTVGNSGAGGANHVAAEGLAMTADIRIRSVPFAGGAAAVAACLDGRIDTVVAHPSEVQVAVRAGHLVPLLVMEETRIPEMPAVPTARELGVDFTWAAWKGLIAPRGMPAEARARLVAALDAMFAEPDFRARLAALGETVDYRPGAAFADLARRDFLAAGRVIRAIAAHNLPSAGPEPQPQPPH